MDIAILTTRIFMKQRLLKKERLRIAQKAVAQAVLALQLFGLWVLFCLHNLVLRYNPTVSAPSH